VKKAAVISFSHLDTDPRVNRHIRFLKDRYRVAACGYSDPVIEDVAFVSVSPDTRRSLCRKMVSAQQLLRGRFEAYYWQFDRMQLSREKLSEINADLILANDIETLPAAIRASRGSKVIFDAHEYAPRQHENLLVWRIFFQKFNTYLCKRYIPKADAMLTVCEGLADQYERDTGIRPEVITNAPDYEDIKPLLGDDNEKPIRLVHHGGALPSRKIENMIDMMDFLDERFELDLVLVTTVSADKAYLNNLKERARKNPRIRFLPPVPMRELVSFLNRYDIGLYLLEPVSFNTRHALPNKLFEFIQARLAVAIGPSPEMARIVKKHGCGVVSADFSPRSLAGCLSRLSPREINRYKQQSHSAARILSAEKNREKLLRLVEQTMGK